MIKKSRNHKKGGDAWEYLDYEGTMKYVNKSSSSVFKVIKDWILGLPWYVVGIILAIVGGFIFLAFGWVMAIGSIIYFSGAIVAIYKSKDTKTDWLWAGAQSWFFVLNN